MVPTGIVGQSKPLSKSLKKKFEKDAKVFDKEAEWARKLSENADFSGALDAELERIREELAKFSLENNKNGELLEK